MLLGRRQDTLRAHFHGPRARRLGGGPPPGSPGAAPHGGRPLQTLCYRAVTARLPPEARVLLTKCPQGRRGVLGVGGPVAGTPRSLSSFGKPSLGSLCPPRRCPTRSGYQLSRHRGVACGSTWVSGGRGQGRLALRGGLPSRRALVCPSRRTRIRFAQGRMGGPAGGPGSPALPAEASGMVRRPRGGPRALRTVSPEDAWARVLLPPDGGKGRVRVGLGGPSCSPLCLGGWGRAPGWTLAL